MEKLAGFDFQEIQCDSQGKLVSGADDLAQFVGSTGVTDVILMCHGFRNDEAHARTLYQDFLTTFGQNAGNPSVSGSLGPRKFAVGGVLWPSMILPEPDDSQGRAQAVGDTSAFEQRLEAMKEGQTSDVQNHLSRMISLVDSAADDQDVQIAMSSILIDLAKGLPVEPDNECPSAFAAGSPEVLQEALVAGDQQPVQAVGAAAGGAVGIPGLDDDITTGVSAQSVIGTVLGFLPKFVNLTTFLLMFHRCGDVGANGMNQAVRRIKALPSAPKLHLVGHSLGGRAVTACAKAMVANPAVQADSLLLLEAAYSQFGLSGGAGESGIPHPRGFFRDVVEKNAIKGPILATFSDQDWVVGFAYAAMAAVSLNNSRANIQESPFGGIGRNGVLDTAEAMSMDLNLGGQPYTFTGKKIHSLDGSRKINGTSLIASHGDVTNSNVTWAFASLVAGT